VDNRNHRTSRRLGILVSCIVAVIAIVSAIWVFAHRLDAPHRESEQTISEFDQRYSNRVIQGMRFDIGTSRTLTNDAPDMAVGAPGRTDQSIETRARAFQVRAGRCAHSSDYPKDTVGRITKDQYLLAQTNASEGLITVSVTTDGNVSVCAKDPERLGDLGTRHTVLLQVQSR